jgi:hypothetical protein
VSIIKHCTELANVHRLLPELSDGSPFQQNFSNGIPAAERSREINCTSLIDELRNKMLWDFTTDTLYITLR